MLSTNSNFLTYLITGVILLISSFYLSFFILKKIGKDPKNILPLNFANRIKVPLIIFLASLLAQIAVISNIFRFEYTSILVGHISILGIILSVTWILIIVLKVFKNRMLSRYDVTSENNLKARKVYTQFMILENIIIFIIIILSIGIALMSFDNIRSIGISVLTSAGIAGLILGFSAQKAIGTLLAGIQIAITQPIRLDDVVIVEKEWGWIEEITLTYVVVRIWDKRRMVLPTTYFIEKPFENWTRNSSDILGTVFIYTDYDIPFGKLREELTRLLESSPLWDKKVNVLQVTNATEKSVELRALMSAKDSPTAWDLRVYVREHLLIYIKENFPDSLPKSRLVLDTKEG
ncbi:mechanosensitive ion channel family protein [Gillisia sp. M10.2A]|uniref:Mechanosensitive ion channel family protein n=1 Tax=Gillisia lutea TaxID=2909668 RepID=A0ABS9EHL2_9FLAO|nr:mechanosensitive ion channel domain-containing protein [Gillisia lutea]MCF4101812.1 mechanosensitive ion channel family protein [Gillisia lutea]